MATHGIDPQARGLATRLVLNILAGLVPAANKIIYFTSASAAALTDLVAQARSFLADPDSQYVNFVQDWSGAVARTARDKLRDFDTLLDAGAVGNGTANDAAAINTALSSGALVIDGLGLTYKINSSITVPAGVTLQNANFTLGVAGINGILVNTGSKLIRVKITGTGTVSTVERAIYPATDGVNDVVLDVEISNLTYGVHIQPTLSVTPKRWSGRIYVHDIVGTAGASEGYGVLMSPASDCSFDIIAEYIKRHALYLSAGASTNRVSITVDGCANYAVQLYSTSGQTETSDNVIDIVTKNLSEVTLTQSGAVAILQKCNRNKVRLTDIGNNGTYQAVLLEGASTGPYPSDNSIFDCIISGQYTGPAVVRLLNAQATNVYNNSINAYSANYVIGNLRAGTNGSTHGGYFRGNHINAQAANIHGIYNEANAQITYISPDNVIINFGTGTRINDSSGGYQRGIAAAIPSQGVSYVGEITLNSVSTAAGVPGWVCTTAGTPGTWKAQAVLAA